MIEEEVKGGGLDGVVRGRRVKEGGRDGGGGEGAGWGVGRECR